MSDPDRGYRREGERPLSFDARQPVRGERAVPVAFLISAGILIVVIVAVVFAYRGGVRGADQAPGAIGEPVAEMKTVAPAEAQPVDPAAGLQIYTDEKGAMPAAGQGVDSGFAPPPEQPLPRPAIPAPSVAPAPTAVQPSGPVAARPINALPPQPAAPAPKAAAPIVAPAARPAPPPATPPATRAAAPVAAAPVAPAASGSFSAQVGAFSSSALADRGWADAVRLAPGAAVGKGKSVEEAQVNGRTVYRALVTGFDSRAGAAAFCASVSAAGGNCLVR